MIALLILFLPWSLGWVFGSLSAVRAGNFYLSLQNPNDLRNAVIPLFVGIASCITWALCAAWVLNERMEIDGSTMRPFNWLGREKSRIDLDFDFQFEDVSLFRNSTIIVWSGNRRIQFHKWIAGYDSLYELLRNVKSP